MTQPLDYATNDVPPEDDHDEPYDRCPMCGAFMAALVVIVMGLSLWGGAQIIQRVMQ